MKDLNLSQDNFGSLFEYNDYLEFVESAIFSLAYEIDVDATKRRIDEFKAAHADAIKSNRLRRRPELAALDSVIEAEASSGGSGGDALHTTAASVMVNSSSSSSSVATATVTTASSNSNGISSGKTRKQTNHQQQQDTPDGSAAAFLDAAAVAELVKPQPPQLNGPAVVDVLVAEGSSSGSSSSAAVLMGILAARLPADYIAGGYTARLGLLRLMSDACCDLFYGLG